MHNPIISIITPTDGCDSLFNAIETITRQKISVKHILLWDDKRDKNFTDNNSIYALDKKEYWETYGYSINNIILKGNRTNGSATGSSLRSVGLMVADTEYVTFMDSDIMWEDGHLISMLQAISESEKDYNWAFCKRKIWTRLPDNNGPQFELIGIDEFESVGEEATTPYKMVDNNCMIFRRKYGASAATLYRETQEYNDDRLMYNFMKTYAGEPAKTGLASINQICPDRLVDFFKRGCTKIAT